MLLAASVAGLIVVATIGLANFWPPMRRLGWAIALLVATLTWMLIAGPSIGSNDLVVWRDALIYFDDRRAVLAAAGAVVAIESVLGRAIQAAGRRRVRSLTSEN